MAHRHRLGGSRGLIQHRGIGNGHTGEVADHRLEVHQGFHTTLGNLGLIRCVGGVPTGILENVPADDGWKMGAVISHADVGGTDLILRSDGTELGKSLFLRKRRGEIE